jgi:hypothetical protein
MPTGERSELESYLGYVCRSIDRIVACLDGLTEEEASTPPAPAASSLRTLAVHAMGNVEENVIGVFARGVVARVRDAEFTNDVPLSEIAPRWRELRERIMRSAGDVSPGELAADRMHPRRGPMTGREVLFVAVRHAAEHMGHAELTRQFMLAQRR